MAVILETARLRLRHLTELDAGFLRRLNENPNVYRYTGDGPVKDDDAALEILRTRIFPQYALHGVGRWAVELVEHEGSPPIGWCGLRWDADVQQYDLGYRFLEEQWGRGYATEAVRATMAWALARFPGHTIGARARIENARSLHILEKVGFVAVGEDDDCDGRVTVFEFKRPPVPSGS